MADAAGNVTQSIRAPGTPQTATSGRRIAEEARAESSPAEFAAAAERAERSDAERNDGRTDAADAGPDPGARGLHFEPIPDLGLTQVFFIDRRERTILKEIPTQERIDRMRAFRRFAALVRSGSRLDVTA